jgi:hypothetical protein
MQQILHEKVEALKFQRFLSGWPDHGAIARCSRPGSRGALELAEYFAYFQGSKRRPGIQIDGNAAPASDKLRRFSPIKAVGRRP